MSTDNGQVLPLYQAATLAGMGHKALKAEAEAGKIPGATNIGKGRQAHWRFLRGPFTEYLKAQGITPHRLRRAPSAAKTAKPAKTPRVAATGAKAVPPSKPSKPSKPDGFFGILQDIRAAVQGLDRSLGALLQTAEAALDQFRR